MSSVFWQLKMIQNQLFWRLTKFWQNLNIVNQPSNFESYCDTNVNAKKCKNLEHFYFHFSNNEFNRNLCGRCLWLTEWIRFQNFRIIVVTSPPPQRYARQYWLDFDVSRHSARIFGPNVLVLKNKEKKIGVHD